MVKETVTPRLWRYGFSVANINATYAVSTFTIQNINAMYTALTFSVQDINATYEASKIHCAEYQRHVRDAKI